MLSDNGICSFPNMEELCTSPLHNFESDYYLDLLFYHLHLRCYVVIELKAGKFKPEYALRDMNKPIGVSAFELSPTLPDDLKMQFPTVEEMEGGLIDEQE